MPINPNRELSKQVLFHASFEPHSTISTGGGVGMIYTGIDLIEIPRVAGVLERYPERFLSKVFTEGEQHYSRGRASQLASRFAAKEAVMKLLGTGVRGVPWKSIEVTRKRGGPPEILLHGHAKIRAGKMGITRIAISLSHSRELATASAVGEASDDAWKP